METQEALHLSSNMQVTTQPGYGGDSDNTMSNPVVATRATPVLRMYYKTEQLDMHHEFHCSAQTWLV
jgi:hypothetical protein